MGLYGVTVVYRKHVVIEVTADGQVDAEEKALQEVFFDDGEVEEVLEIERISGEPHEDDDDYEPPEEDDDDDIDGQELASEHES